MTEREHWVKASFGFLKSVVRHRAEPVKSVSMNTLISILIIFYITFTVLHMFQQIINCILQIIDFESHFSLVV